LIPTTSKPTTKTPTKNPTTSTYKPQCETAWASCQNEFKQGWGSYSKLTKLNSPLIGNIYAGQHYLIGTYSFEIQTNGYIKAIFSIDDPTWGVQNSEFDSNGEVAIYVGIYIPKSAPGLFNFKVSPLAGTMRGEYYVKSPYASLSSFASANVAMHLNVCKTSG